MRSQYNSKNSNRRRLIYPNINLGKLSGIHLRHFSRRQLPPFLEGRGRGKVAVCLTFILDRKLDTGGWNEDLAGRECNPLTPFDKLAEFDSARDSIEMQNIPCINISHRSENCHVNLWQEKLYAQNGLRSSCPPEPAT